MAYEIGRACMYAKMCVWRPDGRLVSAKGVMEEGKRRLSLSAELVWRTMRPRSLPVPSGEAARGDDRRKDRGEVKMQKKQRAEGGDGGVTGEIGNQTLGTVRPSSPGAGQRP